MKCTTAVLENFRQHRDYVSVERGFVADQCLDGFIIAYSEDLVLLQHVHDFHLNGLALLRRADITEIKTTDTLQFQRSLLVDDGVLDLIDFDQSPPLNSYADFLAALPSDRLVILEDEAADDPDFWIGCIQYADNECVVLRYLSCLGKMFEKPSQLLTQQITLCQVDTNYIRAYQRHLLRSGIPGEK